MHLRGRDARVSYLVFKLVRKSIRLDADRCRNRFVGLGGEWSDLRIALSGFRAFGKP